MTTTKTTPDEKPFSEISENAVIVSTAVFNGRFIVATPHELYEVSDGKLKLMKFVKAEDITDDTRF